LVEALTALAGRRPVMWGFLVWKRIGDLVGRAADWVGDMFRRDVLCIISEQHNIREQH
jgi:hypothetical protein